MNLEINLFPDALLKSNIISLSSTGQFIYLSGVSKLSLYE